MITYTAFLAALGFGADAAADEIVTRSVGGDSASEGASAVAPSRTRMGYNFLDLMSPASTPARSGLAMSAMDPQDLVNAIGQDRLAELCDLMDPTHRETVCGSEPKPKKEGPITGSKPLCEATYSKPGETVAFCGSTKVGETLSGLGLKVEVHPGKDYAFGKPENQCPGGLDQQCIAVSKPKAEDCPTCPAEKDCPDPKTKYVCPGPDGKTVDNKDDCPFVEPVAPIEKIKYRCPTGETVDDSDDCPDDENEGMPWGFYGGFGGSGFLPGGPYMPTELGVELGITPAFWLGAYGVGAFPFGDSDSETNEHAANYEATSAGGHLIGSQLTDVINEKPAMLWKAGARGTWRFLRGSAGHLGGVFRLGYAAVRGKGSKKTTQHGWMQTQEGEIFQEGVPGPLELPGSSYGTRSDCLEVGGGLEGQLNIAGPWNMRVSLESSYLHDFTMQRHLGNLRGMLYTGFEFGGPQDE